MSEARLDTTVVSDRTINDGLRSLLNETALEAIGHFFLSWDEECAPRVLAPYKYGFCNEQHGSAYAEFSQYFLDREFRVRDLLKQTEFDQEDRDFIEEVNEECERILNKLE